MELKINFNYSVEIDSCNIDHLTAVFKQLAVRLFADFVTSVMHTFAERYMHMKSKPFACSCGNSTEFGWKTRNAKLTKISTIFDDIRVPQMQVRCIRCDRKMFITRALLGIEKYQRMSTITEKMLGKLGVLCSFRVSEEILAMFGLKQNRMKVWRCVQKIGAQIKLGLDPDELPAGEADGTGIPTQGIRKRGRELKVFVQKKVGGGVRIAGLDIGQYNGGWDKLFRPLLQSLRTFKQFLIITDGDTNILKPLKNVNVFLQRCLWHIPHQLKHCLWEDGVERKSEDWKYIMGRIFDISATRPYLADDEIQAVVDQKRLRLDNLIAFCRERGYQACASYLHNARPDMFTSLERRLHGKSTSLAERVMRTVNLRIKVGKWTRTGALNAMKLRLAHYYNGWTPAAPEVNAQTIRRIQKNE